MKTTDPTKHSSIKRVLTHLVPDKPTIFIASIALLGMVCLSLIRVVLAIRQTEMFEDLDRSQIWDALFIGARFDIVISFYTLLIPIILISIAQFTNGRIYRILTRTAVVLCAIMYSLLLIIHIADIPFYEHFNTHLNALVINYTTSGPIEAIEMIVKDSTYRLFAISSIASAVIFCIVAHILSKKFLSEGPSNRKVYTIIATLLFYALTPIWCRGLTLQKRPMDNIDAYISDYKAINEIAKNPIFTIIASFNSLSNSIDLIDPKVALEFAQQELGRDENFSTFHEGKESPWKHIIVIVQESSTTHRLTREGNTRGLVPHLDTLITQSLYFENTYSSNIRTCCGLYSIVTSMPAYASINPMCTSYFELPTLIRQYSTKEEFQTMFFVTHEPSYDNIQDFVLLQGFEQAFCSNKYGIPESELKTWGVDDHVMFDFAIEKIDDEIASGNRVIATCLTCSNHIPYQPPMDVGFVPKDTETDEVIAIQYADWALNRFIEAAKQKEWFDETLFVITGDHGKAISQDFDIPDSYVHIPLLFYSPKHIQPEVRNDLVAQIDIMPTAFGMAGLEFENRTLGIDINRQQRRMIPYGAYTCIAARDYDWNYIYSINDNIGFLYDLNAEPDQRYHNVIKEHPEIADSMHHYAACMTQTGWTFHNNIK